MNLLLILLLMISYLAASLPLVIGLISAYRYRSSDNPSARLIGTLCATSAGSVIVLFTCPYLDPTYSALLLSGTVVTGAMGLALWIRRFRSLSPALVAVGIGVIEFAVWGWVDFRFRVVVQDRDGKPVEIQDGSIDLRHPPETYLGSYQSGKGVRLKKGIIYFGFLQWLEHKDHWTFSGGFCDQNGHFLGDLEWKNAKWSEWPKYIVVK
jgi:hypothetical protein